MGWACINRNQHVPDIIRLIFRHAKTQVNLEKPECLSERLVLVLVPVLVLVLILLLVLVVVFLHWDLELGLGPNTFPNQGVANISFLTE